MRHLISASVLLAGLVACTGQLPPPPALRVTSPQRGLVQNGPGKVTVTGTAAPGADGARVIRVTVNHVPATLAADGSFSATVDVPPGATLLETTAVTDQGGSAIDARAVEVGELRPIGSTIERAVTASLSTEAFAKLAAVAGPKLRAMDFGALLAPMSFGDSIANAKLTVNKITLSDVKITLTPSDAGLQFSVELDGINVAAKADYSGALVPDGSTNITVTADQATLSGTLAVTPAGVMGFTTKVASPSVKTTNLKLQASGLIGDVVSLIQDNLASTVQKIAQSSAESALQPLINSALGALSGPQHIAVLGRSLDIQATPAALAFSRAGAIVTMNLQAKIAGSESSPGFIYTPNGTPKLDVGNGIQLGLADDLLNQMLAQVHALGVLNLELQQDFGILDEADFKLTVPPMISADRDDGALRLVIGDMIATFSDKGKTIVRTAINAQVDVTVLRGSTPDQIALKFGTAKVFVNVLDDPNNPSEMSSEDVTGAAGAGIGVQLDSLSQFMINVPVPQVAGVTLDNLALHGDAGYLVASGQIH